MCIVIIQRNDINSVIRYFVCYYLFCNLSIVYIYNSIVCSVPLAIHSSYRILNDLFVKQSMKMNYNLKFKLINIIEKLSKKKIGFTCYDCLTFDYFELVIFYANLIAAYILIVKILN
jgi:hypothetical protein